MAGPHAVLRAVREWAVVVATTRDVGYGYSVGLGLRVYVLYCTGLCRAVLLSGRMNDHGTRRRDGVGFLSCGSQFRLLVPCRTGCRHSLLALSGFG